MKVRLRKVRPGRSVGVAALLVVATTALPPAGHAAPATDAIPAPVAGEVTAAVAAEGSADFWVVFNDRADLTPAHDIPDWARRGRYVYDRLTTAASASQAGLVGRLAARDVELEAFWVVNAVLVRGGDRAALDTARADSGVAEIRAPRTLALPEPVAESSPGDGARIGAVEWGIANIGADRVWSDFRARGEGIVIGSIDTGVEFVHPALVDRYRGNLGDGSFAHDYHWWDPSQVCPADEPCDNHGHGTHTTGTLVGDDGAGNQIGVAPGAAWIAAKGCETDLCSDEALLSAGQFMLAPTDLAGGNPRPDMRPQVVNNSWGSDESDPWFDQLVGAWVAAGMFPVFSNGNAGPACDTAGSPADGPDAYGVGAYDVNHNIALFSSRGPGRGDEVRPHLAAPGVAVRSSVPAAAGRRYLELSGTSMAAPHVSGTVALMWSAAPDLVGDPAATRDLLDTTAIDVDDTACGGTLELNNVWGQGRLDAYTAVRDSPRGTAGASQEIVAMVPEEPGEGSLIISVDPDDRTVTLPDLRLAGTGDRLATGGELRPVTVTDTRTSPNPGWDVTGQVTDFESGDGSFGGGFLGWTPEVASASDGQEVTPGVPVDPGFPTGDGLSVPQTLGTTPAGAGAGSAVLMAGLELQIPVTTPPGTYPAVLTLTAI